MPELSPENFRTVPTLIALVNSLALFSSPGWEGSERESERERERERERETDRERDRERQRVVRGGVVLFLGRYRKGICRICIIDRMIVGIPPSDFAGRTVLRG